jgi:hypothetical protein
LQINHISTARLRCACATALLCAALSAVAISAQAPVAMGRPDAEFAEPFSQIAGVRELKDGRVLVADPREKIVVLIDFKSGHAIKVGREGSGPGEYGMPQRIIALPGDTSAIYDPSNLRYLVIGPDGKTGPNFRLEELLSGGHSRPGGAAPHGTDARGRIFFEGPAFTTTSAGRVVPADSTPVLRYDRTTQRIDTIAYVKLAEGNAQVSSERTGLVQMQVGRKPFPARDDWAALSDGGVAVVRVHDYHVDAYFASGRHTSGPRVRVDAIPVTEADKEEWRAERRGIAGLQLGRGGAPMRGALPRSASEPEFPAFKPPFVMGAVARPNGELWVLRSRKASDMVPVYDVFNATGTLIARVALPALARIIGIGDGTLYVARTDPDDLQYLQRYQVPAFAKPGN